ncbi:MAG: hypothetical protein RJA15_1684 [Actinomycetota bacterium]|jgi:hypothetical protein
MRLRKQKGPVVANGDGSFSISLTADERETLLGFVDQLATILLSGPDDARLRRLYPTAYHNDPEHDAEYQGYMRDELSQSRMASIAVVQEVLASEIPITESQLHAFMTVLNNLRLVLGTLLDVGEDDDEPDEDDPAFGQWQLYSYLGWLLEWTVSALTE